MSHTKIHFTKRNRFHNIRTPQFLLKYQLCCCLVLACAGDAKTYSPFEIGARITEVGMLGLALRMQKPILWDAENRRVTGLPEADAIIDPKPSTNAYLLR
ncbi:MAG: hypothetical protein NTX48_07140 [Planctomycetales bacterium]|nr:hypothetical protein [Planctomycetales bacterium]